MAQNRCASCGAASELDFGFVSQRGGKAYCAVCWEQRTSKQQALALGALGALYATLALTGAPVALTVLRAALLLPAAVAAHELGHLVAARLLGLGVPELHIGTGPTQVRFRIAGLRVEIHAIPLSGAALVAHRNAGPGLRWRRFVVILAGPLVNALLLLGAVVFHAVSPGWALALQWTNVLLLVAALWPRSVTTPYGTQHSDGVALWRIRGATDDDISELLVGSYAAEALARYKDGEFQEAREWLERGLAQCPDAAPLMGLLAVQLSALGEHEAARSLHLKLLERPDVAPEQRAIDRNNLAWADLVSADPRCLDEALSASEAAMVDLEWLPAVQNTRGFALLEAGDLGRGMMLCKLAFERERDPQNRAAAACVLAIGAARTGQIRQARLLVSHARHMHAGCPLLGRAQEEIDRAATPIPSLAS